jgi:hypothetical protein
MILMGANPLLGLLEWVGPENFDFSKSLRSALYKQPVHE